MSEFVVASEKGRVIYIRQPILKTCLGKMALPVQMPLRI